MAIENEHWAASFAARDPGALEAAMDTHAAAVYGLIRRILAGLGSDEDAEECASDAFLAAWNQIGEFDAERSTFRSWLLMLAKYKALDLRRKLIRRQGRIEEAQTDANGLALAGGQDVEAAILSREQSRELIAIITKLPHPDRELFIRRYYRYEEIGELSMTFGLSKKAVESRLYRARQTLRQEWHRITEEEPSHEID